MVLSPVRHCWLTWPAWCLPGVCLVSAWCLPALENSFGCETNLLAVNVSPEMSKLNHTTASSYTREQLFRLESTATWRCAQSLALFQHIR